MKTLRKRRGCKNQNVKNLALVVDFEKIAVRHMRFLAIIVPQGDIEPGGDALVIDIDRGDEVAEMDDRKALDKIGEMIAERSFTSIGKIAAGNPHFAIVGHAFHNPIQIMGVQHFEEIGNTGLIELFARQGHGGIFLVGDTVQHIAHRYVF